MAHGRYRKEVDESAESDLGLGGEHGRSSRRRLLNRDGRFNVQRSGAPWWERISYLALLNMAWPEFFLVLTLVYVASNVLFAGAYVLCGSHTLAVNGPDDGTPYAWRAFFFSVQTLSTIGYGSLVPMGMRANILVAIESVYGLLSYALITGLFFARFSRIRARIRFSKVAVVTRRGERSYLHIRLTNVSRSEIIEVSGRVLFSHFEGERGAEVRRYAPVAIEPKSVAFLPLSWTISHVIDESSPLYELTLEQMRERRVELLVLLTGMDDSSAQTINARTSYMADEIAFGHGYADMFQRDGDGAILGIDLQRFDEVRPDGELEAAYRSSGGGA